MRKKKRKTIITTKIVLLDGNKLRALNHSSCQDRLYLSIFSSNQHQRVE
jgi:hypothetical protein